MMFVPSLSVRRAALVSAVITGSSLAFADVLVVNATSGPFATLQSAIAVAHDGDTVLVKPGAYAQFILDAKSLTIVADVGGPVNVNGACAVRNLNANQRAVLSGLTMVVPNNWNSPSPDFYTSGLTVTNNAGEVRMNACTSIGRSSTSAVFTGGVGGDGVRVTNNSGSVALVGCAVAGGRGENTHDWSSGSSLRGGSGVNAQDTRVALYNCTVAGGRGGDGFDYSSRGGNAVWLRTSTASAGLLASGCQFIGGRGGDDWEDIFNDLTMPGSGGNGFELDGGTSAQIVECSFVGGAPGVGVFCTPTSHAPSPGVGVNGSGTMFTFNATKVVLGAPTVVRESSSLSITVTGQPGDRAYLFLSRGTSFNALPSWRGVLLTQNATPPRTMILGTIPLSGVLSTNLALPDLGPGVVARDMFLQAYRSDVNGSITLGNLAIVSVLDSSY